jgi:hypothetical protein
MSCPSGHILKDNVCTISPTLTCPPGYDLVNGMCLQISSPPSPSNPMDMTMRRMGVNPMTDTTNTTQQMPASGDRVPIAPITTSACPEGFSLNSSDNMCYPL